MSKFRAQPSIMVESDSLEYFLKIFGKPPVGGGFGGEKETLFEEEQETRMRVRRSNEISCTRLS